MTTDPVSVGGHDVPLDLSEALYKFCMALDERATLGNGPTALFWHLVNVASSHVKSAAPPLTWLDMESAPKDGTPIVGLCVHKADPYWLDEHHLTIYGGHTEGFSHVQDGPHVIQWGGAYDDSTWESPGASMPDWWFQSGSDFEVTANPVGWLPIAAYKERL